MVYIIRYGELWLKGRNRAFFISALKDDLMNKLRRDGIDATMDVKHTRLLLHTDADAGSYLARTFGISSFSQAVRVDDIHEAERLISEIVKTKKPSSFRITAHRVDKDYPSTSQELNHILGSHVFENFHIPVDLKHPDMDIGVEVLKDGIYIFTEKVPGAGGLPYGVAGPVNVLLSTGMDSPVAAWLMMKRGCRVTYIHFSTGDDMAVHSLHDILSTYGDSELMVVDYDEVLSVVRNRLLEANLKKWQCIACKYGMLSVASSMRQPLALVTGDSLGQVASQTLHNMSVISSQIPVPIFRPLIGMDKNEIISIAKRIGTYELTARKTPKCPFVPKYPLTRADSETFLVVKEIVDEVIKETY